MDETLRLIGAERVGTLATVGLDGSPHLVPVVFALTGEMIVTAVDWKPKGDRRLRRLENIEANPSVSFLAHRYSEDWTDLWWARVDGAATLHDHDPIWEGAVAALTAKYAQYHTHPPEGEVIAIVPERVRSWTSRS